VISSQVPYGNGLTVSVLGIVVGGVILAILTGLAGYVINKIKDNAKDAKDAALATKESITEVNEKVGSVLAVLTTPLPTELNPRPTPGLVEAVMGKGGLVDTVAELKVTSTSNQRLLADHSRQLSVLMTGSAALVKDIHTDDGSSSRDALDRIEANTQGKA